MKSCQIIKKFLIIDGADEVRNCEIQMKYVEMCILFFFLKSLDYKSHTKRALTLTIKGAKVSKGKSIAEIA